MGGIIKTMYANDVYDNFDGNYYYVSPTSAQRLGILGVA